MTAEVFLSQDAAKDRKGLDAAQDRKLVALARQLAVEVALGDQLQRDRIPKQLRKTYACDNLWRLELPGAWRILYTIQSRLNEGISVSILRILSHKAYDRLLGYSTS